MSDDAKREHGFKSAEIVDGRPVIICLCGYRTPATYFEWEVAGAFFDQHLLREAE